MTALQVLHAMIAEYVHQGRRIDRMLPHDREADRLMQFGRASMIIHVAGLLYSEDQDTASERVAEMINDAREAMVD